MDCPHKTTFSVFVTTQLLPKDEASMMRYQISYEKAIYDQSYNRTESGWVWSNNLTPGSLNIIPAPVLKSKKEAKEEEIQKSTNEKGLAAVSERIPKKISSFFPLLIAAGIAIFSGIIILILKKTTTRPPPSRLADP